jgi:hypothetical protein
MTTKQRPGGSNVVRLHAPAASHVTALDREMMARGMLSCGGLPDPLTCPAVNAYRAALAHATPAEFDRIAGELWDTVARLQWQAVDAAGPHTLH